MTETGGRKERLAPVERRAKIATPARRPGLFFDLPASSCSFFPCCRGPQEELAKALFRTIVNFAARGEQRSIGGKRDCVHPSAVAIQHGHLSLRCHVPKPDRRVPTSRRQGSSVRAEIESSDSIDMADKDDSQMVGGRFDQTHVTVDRAQRQESPVV
jgi:hypothetical protein